METRIAKTFVKVAEMGCITRAAEQLGYSQAAVTSQIQQLEADLGVKLFDRVGRGIQLTDAGRNFRQYAVNLIRASEDADGFAMDQREPEGKLVIDATSSVSIGILPRLVAAFHKRYPKVRISVRLSEDTDILVDHVRQNQVDFAFLFGRRERYEGCLLAGEERPEFRFVTTPEDRLAGKKKVPLQEIMDKTFVSSFISTGRNTQKDYVMESYLRRTGYDVQAPVEFSPIAAVANYLRYNGGHAFLPLFMIEQELARGELCIIDTEPIEVYEYIQVLYSATRWISPQAKAFLTFMGEEMPAPKEKEEREKV